MYKDKAEAEQDAAKMTGWNNVRVVIDEELAIDGSEVIYITATEPESGRPVIFDSPSQPQARFV